MARPPKPLFERLKLPLILIAYVAASEWASPFPFRASLPARLAIFALVLLVLREFHHARLEVDADWAGRTGRVEASIRRRASGISRRTWLKVQRVGTWTLLLYVFGMMVNSLTTRCDSAVQCTVLAPRLAMENLPLFIQFMVMVSLGMAQLALMFYAMVKVGSYKLVMPGTIRETFDDVWGQDAAKAKVMEQVRLLENSDDVERAGGYMPKGILLWGPPGTGKTLLAKAAANFSSKPLILVPPGAFQATFVGINLLKVWTLFRMVRKLARRYGGVIVFIDEIDSLGSRGGDVSSFKQFRLARTYYADFLSDKARGRTPRPEPVSCVGCVRLSRHETSPEARSGPDEPRRVIVTGNNQMGTLEAFLSAVDGMEEPRGALNRILVFLGFKPLRPYDYKYSLMGATNMKERIDPALLRAGRFGRHIHVTFPKIEGRQKTYEGYLGKVTNDLSPENVEWAARNHARGTGAEIRDIVNDALLISFRDDRDDPGIVHFPDLMDAMLWTRYGESDGPFEREEARWNVAVHEAGHAVAFHLLCRHRQRIWFASIDRRGETGGMVAPTSLHEDWLLTRDELLADIQVSLASRVAEKLLIGTTTNGHGGDAASATADAQRMVGYGQATQIGVYESDKDDVRKQTEDILGEALDACQALLEPHQDDIKKVAQLLCEQGTVTGDSIHEMLEAAA